MCVCKLLLLIYWQTLTHGWVEHIRMSFHDGDSFYIFKRAKRKANNFFSGLQFPRKKCMQTQITQSTRHRHFFLSLLSTGWTHSWKLKSANFHFFNRTDDTFKKQTHFRRQQNFHCLFCDFLILFWVFLSRRKCSIVLSFFCTHKIILAIFNIKSSSNEWRGVEEEVIN